jgi:hypothetical protein
VDHKKRNYENMLPLVAANRLSSSGFDAGNPGEQKPLESIFHILNNRSTQKAQKFETPTSGRL